MAVNFPETVRLFSTIFRGSVGVREISQGSSMSSISSRRSLSHQSRNSIPILISLNSSAESESDSDSDSDECTIRRSRRRPSRAFVLRHFNNFIEANYGNCTSARRRIARVFHQYFRRYYGIVIPFSDFLGSQPSPSQARADSDSNSAQREAFSDSDEDSTVYMNCNDSFSNTANFYDGDTHSHDLQSDLYDTYEDLYLGNDASTSFGLLRSSSDENSLS